METKKIVTTSISLESLILEIEYCIKKDCPFIKIEPFGIGYKITAKNG